jgi:hypothetical protein
MAAGASAVQEPPPDLDPETEKTVCFEAKKAAYAATQQGLMAGFQRGEVDVDQLLKTTRELARNHFQFDIFPNM